MNRKISVVLVFMFLLSAMLSALSTSVRASTTHHVYPGQSIQAAINSAQSGDTIFVHAGMYNEYSIVVDKSSLTLKGENKDTTIINGSSPYYGVKIRGDNITITNFTIQNFGKGITFWARGTPWSTNTIQNNRLLNNIDGIWLQHGTNTTVSFNMISGSGDSAIVLWETLNNTIRGNTISSSTYGIYAFQSADNQIYHNNFIDNTQQVDFSYAQINFWDDGYPSGGNYWSNYAGVDEKNGINQDQPGCDGYGDTPHVIDGNNQDNYPLMHPFTPPIETTVTWNDQVYPVTTVSNTTIGPIEQHGQHTLRFTATGEGDMGYIFFITPKFTDSEPTVKINGHNPPDPFPTINDNGTHWFIYFEFPLSTNIIDIYFPAPVGGIYIPVNKLGLLSPYIGLTLLLAVAVVAVVYVKKRKRHTETNS